MENKLKHLDFLQLVITRMSVNSFLIKGWAVTLVAALFAFAAKETNIKLAIISFISTFTFWLLDGYYLSQERRYRCLYNDVRVKDEAEIDFNMDASGYNDIKNSWFKCIFSETLNYFYGALVLTNLIVIYILSSYGA
jgi:hypothetical protein